MREAPAIGSELALSLNDMHDEAGLIVFLGGVGRTRGRRYGRVAGQYFVDHAAADLDTQ